MKQKRGHEGPEPPATSKETGVIQPKDDLRGKEFALPSRTRIEVGGSPGPTRTPTGGTEGGWTKVLKKGRKGGGGSVQQPTLNLRAEFGVLRGDKGGSGGNTQKGQVSATVDNARDPQRRFRRGFIERD